MHGDIMFPVRAAIDLCDRRAERCKSLCEVLVHPDSATGEPVTEGTRADPAPKVSDGKGADPESHKAPEAEDPVLAIPEYPRDNRGEGEVVEGAKKRKYLGSSRPPGISPETWKRMTPHDKEERIREHLGSLKILQQKCRVQFGERRPERLRGLPGYKPEVVHTIVKNQAKAKRKPTSAAVELAQRVSVIRCARIMTPRGRSLEAITGKLSREVSYAGTCANV